MVTHLSKRDIQNISQLSGATGINHLDFLSARNSVPDDNPTIAIVERTGGFVEGGGSR